MAPRIKKPAEKGPTTAQQLHAAYERRAAEALPGTADDWRRDHLGASIIGHECDRYLWLSFRWATPKKLDGRALRLLERGKREELWLIDDLQALGVKVHPTDDHGRQHRVQWGHVGGSCDFVCVGLIEAPDVWHVGEAKTSNARQFERLVEKGVKQARPEHYVQMQVYMHGLGIDWALYIAVCKDNDRIHTERVPYVAEEAAAAVKRAQDIVAMPSPPDRQSDALFPPCTLTSKDGTTWPCQFHAQCWKGGLPARSCRTCVSSTPLPDGSWRCEHLDKLLTGAEQRAACSSHLSLPDVVGWQVAKIWGRQITYQAADGTTVVDGDAQ